MALKEIAERNPDVTIIYPVHLNLMSRNQSMKYWVLTDNQIDGTAPKNIFF